MKLIFLKVFACQPVKEKCSNVEPHVQNDRLYTFIITNDHFTHMLPNLKLFWCQIVLTKNLLRPYWTHTFFFDHKRFAPKTQILSNRYRLTSLLRGSKGGSCVYICTVHRTVQLSREKPRH